MRQELFHRQDGSTWLVFYKTDGGDNRTPADVIQLRDPEFPAVCIRCHRDHRSLGPRTGRSGPFRPPTLPTVIVARQKRQDEK